MRPLYAGRVRMHGTEYPRQHEAIVSHNLWERANAAVRRSLQPARRLTGQICALLGQEEKLAGYFVERFRRGRSNPHFMDLRYFAAIFRFRPYLDSYDRGAKAVVAASLVSRDGLFLRRQLAFSHATTAPIPGRALNT
jgi:hypothetical protein